jgi:hypothetical protein
MNHSHVSHMPASYVAFVGSAAEDLRPHRCFFSFVKRRARVRGDILWAGYPAFRGLDCARDPVREAFTLSQ